MKFVIEIVNFIRLNGKTHRQFRNFIEELELEDKLSDVSFYCIVRWLSTSNVLSRIVNIFPDIEIKDYKVEEHKDKLQGLLDNFLPRFHDLRKLKPCFAFLVNPFMIDVVNGCPILEPLVTKSFALKMEVMELQEDLGLKMIHKSQPSTEFWKQVPQIKYPKLKKTGVRLISIFSTTYCCESLYSVMKFVKSKHRAIFTNQHLTYLIRIALTT
ncbi:SCAN domain-containing protein 3-like [Octopus sinensis]|uniref:SCAN domain-containing protein 3-like n=1 Tax=Octopus sinensis TaxID=2607531 RepID=A0A7E6ESJ9_9MOLL|nr:SCAN domain-containing protein 3-like [Octopus sinensis]